MSGHRIVNVPLGTQVAVTPAEPEISLWLFWFGVISES